MRTGAKRVISLMDNNPKIEVAELQKLLPDVSRSAIYSAMSKWRKKKGVAPPVGGQDQQKVPAAVRRQQAKANQIEQCSKLKKEGWSREEIAEILHISVATVRRREETPPPVSPPVIPPVHRTPEPTSGLENLDNFINSLSTLATEYKRLKELDIQHQKEAERWRSMAAKLQDDIQKLAYTKS